MNKNNVYTYSAETAQQNGDIDLFRESRRLNESCAKAINDAIHANNTSEYHYDMKAAVNAVIAEYGTERMNYVLANTVQNNDHDGRFSQSNKEWAKAFAIPQDSNNYSFEVTTRRAILDGFIQKARSICSELHKEQKPSILNQVKDNSASIASASKKDVPTKKDGLEV